MGEFQKVEITTPPAGAEAPTPVVQADPNRPAWLPEKFKTPEDMAKSYAEAEKKISELSKPKTEEKPKVEEKPGEPSKVVPNEFTQDEAAIKQAGLNLNDLEKEFQTNGGKLSEESNKKLQDIGITPERITAYQRGLQAQSDDFEKSVVKGIKGGMEDLKKALDWAKDSLSASEAKAFNDTMARGNADEASLAAEGLVSRFTRAQGPQLIEGRPAQDRADAYESRAQQIAEINDPRYKNDPAFRNRAMAKAMRSNFNS